jgi:hypothetical protein
VSDELYKPYDRNRGAVRMVGVAWQMSAETGKWVRHVLRCYPDGEAYWSKTHHVEDGTSPFCTGCFSNHVSLSERNGRMECWYCHECNKYFSFRLDI